jgi:hypothetical protein
VQQPVRSAYQPPASSTFLSEQTSHQQSASSTFLSEQISTSHQPPAKRTGCGLVDNLKKEKQNDLLDYIGYSLTRSSGSSNNH